MREAEPRAVRRGSSRLMLVEDDSQLLAKFLELVQAGIEDLHPAAGVRFRVNADLETKFPGELLLNFIDVIAPGSVARGRLAISCMEVPNAIFNQMSHLGPTTGAIHQFQPWKGGGIPRSMIAHAGLSENGIRQQ